MTDTLYTQFYFISNIDFAYTFSFLTIICMYLLTVSLQYFPMYPLHFVFDISSQY